VDERLVALSRPKKMCWRFRSAIMKNWNDLSLEGELPEWAKWECGSVEFKVVTPPEAIV